MKGRCSGGRGVFAEHNEMPGDAAAQAFVRAGNWQTLQGAYHRRSSTCRLHWHRLRTEHRSAGDAMRELSKSSATALLGYENCVRCPCRNGSRTDAVVVAAELLGRCSIPEVFEAIKRDALDVHGGQRWRWADKKGLPSRRHKWWEERGWGGPRYSSTVELYSQYNGNLLQ